MSYFAFDNKALFSCDDLSPFFEKGYGIEVMLFLYDQTSSSSEGIEHLYTNLLSVRSTYASFNRYIHRLVDLGLLRLVEGRIKKSRKSVLLSEHIRNTLNQLIKIDS
jgi:hypothetical protein